MLICDLKNIDNIDKYNVDALVVNSKEFSCYNDTSYNLQDLEVVVQKIHQNSKQAVLSIDRIIDENELSEFNDYLENVTKLDFDKYIFSDFSVIAFFKSINQLDKLIYDSKTLITNIYDAKFYQQQGIDIIIANELTLEDIKLIADSGNCYLDVYGYHQVFYSRRLILKAYQEYLKTPFQLNDRLLFLKEEFREELYPIYQSSKGTFIYNSHMFMIFKELKQISSLNWKINSQFIDEEQLFAVISFYNQLQLTNDDEVINRLEEQLKALNGNVTPGFLYKSSVLCKVDNDE